MNTTSQRPASSTNRPEAVSAPDTSRAGCGAVLFCLAFLLFGLGFMTPFAMAAWKSGHALTWQRVPCVIDQSRLESHNGDDGNTYSVEVAYHFRWQGRDYTGDRYKFLDMTTSGRKLKERVLRRYPVGSEAHCWVDPDDPTRSVLNRGLTLDYLFALIPGIFVLIGGVGVAASLGLLPARFGDHKKLDWRRKHRRNPPQPGTSLAAVAHHTGPTRFVSSRGIGTLLVQLVAFAMFAGALVFLFRIDEAVIWIFRIGFGLATLVLGGSVIHSLLALRNPSVVLLVNQTRVNPGDELHIQIQVDGRSNVFDTFALALQGVEEARYTRGTDTITDTHVFHCQTIAELPAGVRPDGSFTVRVPDDAMHSFSSRHNKIRWLLAVNGEIDRWPDVEDRHELEVQPAPDRPRDRSDRDGAPGGSIEMDVDWQFDEQPERVEIRLVWFTSGKGDRDVSVVEVRTIEPALASSSRRVRFSLPEGPRSYAGRLLSIQWAIEVLAIPSGESCRFDFEVMPSESGSRDFT